MGGTHPVALLYHEHIPWSEYALSVVWSRYPYTGYAPISPGREAERIQLRVGEVLRPPGRDKYKTCVTSEGTPRRIPGDRKSVV